MSTVISRLDDFEGRPITTIQYRGRPCWIAREVGQALGYDHGGHRFVNQVLGRWADELVEESDYMIVRGNELAALKDFVGTDLVPSKSNRELLLLFESGLHLACLRTTKPMGKKLRRFLAVEVLPQLIRTGEYRRPRQVTELEPEERKRLGREMLELLNDAVAYGMMEHWDAQRRWQQSMALFFDKATLVVPVGPYQSFLGKPMSFELALARLGPEYGFDGSTREWTERYEAHVVSCYPPDQVGGAKLMMKRCQQLDGPRNEPYWCYPESLHRLLLPEFLALHDLTHSEHTGSRPGWLARRTEKNA